LALIHDGFGFWSGGGTVTFGLQAQINSTAMEKYFTGWWFLLFWIWYLVLVI
jgi:hypothetical protein